MRWMRSGRLEAFSDGVVAIVITLMALELHVPKDSGERALLDLLPVLLSYLLSFLTVAIYWINHHLLMSLIDRVSTPLLWLNIHFLFWLSLLPFVTAYLGAQPTSPMAAAMYGGVAAACSLSFLRLRHWVASQLNGADQQEAAKRLASVLVRGRMSALLLLASIPMAFVSPRVSIAMFCFPPLLHWVAGYQRGDALAAPSNG